MVIVVYVVVCVIVVICGGVVCVVVVVDGIYGSAGLLALKVKGSKLVSGTKLLRQFLVRQG